MIKKQTVSDALTKATDTVRTMSPGRLQLFLTVGILVLGIFLTFILIISRKPPQRAEQQAIAPLVKVKQMNVRDIQMVIRGYGTVKPKVQVEIIPQVSGKVVSVHPQFKTGGFISTNEEFLKIDPRDYELAVQQTEAVVAEAQVKLDIEKAEGRVAQQEWQQLNPDTEPLSPLVLRQPQIQQAQAKLESAKAQLATARLNLERTSLSLPVDICIMSKNVDLGQYLMTGQSVGVAYGIDVVEIEVPLEDEDLAWFDIPVGPASFNGNDPSTKAAIAKVKADFAGTSHIWTGYVTRTTGQVDRTSRLVSVVVEVLEPFNTSDSVPPLLPGMFVEVMIEGNIVKDAIAVPRDVIHNGNEVWVVSKGRLHIQPLEIARADKDFVFCVSGLDDGAMIVTSSLDIVVEAMKVRTQLQGQTKPNQLNQDGNKPDLMEAK
jgi:RND family efflux transporter MFP subunit